MAILIFFVVFAIALVALVMGLCIALSLYVSAQFALSVSSVAGKGKGLSFLQSLKIACLIAVPISVFWQMPHFAWAASNGHLSSMSDYFLAISLLTPIGEVAGALVVLLTFTNWHRNPIRNSELRYLIATCFIATYLLLTFAPYGIVTELDARGLPKDLLYFDWISYFFLLAAPLIVVPTIAGRTQRILGALLFSTGTTAGLALAISWLAL
ncbi:MAG: hypothetical protein AAFV38_00550 [Pseudomonadota bacterium]